MRLQIIVLCGISLLWGSEWIASPLLAQVAAPFAASALTLTCAALFLLGTSCFLVSPGPAVSFRINLLLAFALFAAPLALLIAAGQHGAAGWTPLLYSMLPLFVAFADGAWMPAMVLAPGAALVLLNGTVPFAPRNLAWALAALAAVASQAWALRLLARALRGRPIVRALGLQAAMAAALLYLGSVWLDPAPRLSPFAPWSALPVESLVLIAALGTALPYAGLYRLLARGPLRPEQVAVTQWLQLLVAGAESAAFAHARPGWPWLAAAALLAVCCWSVLRARFKPFESP